MWEKLKDILYEVSDILFALVIILIMSTVITWQVTDSLAYSKEKVTRLDEPKKNVSVHQETQESFNEVEAPLPLEHEETDLPSNDVSITQNEETSTQEVPVEPAPTQKSPIIVHVEIPSGISGIGISKILKEKGLIQDASQFIARVEELKLESKLKSGIFDIKSDSTLDDIIYIIVGKKK